MWNHIVSVFLLEEIEDWAKWPSGNKIDTTYYFKSGTQSANRCADQLLGPVSHSRPNSKVTGTSCVLWQYARALYWKESSRSVLFTWTR